MHNTLFIENLTSMDFAAFFEEDGLWAASFWVNVALIGTISPKDSTILDFSDAKKLIKHLIDENFDHKFFIPANRAQKHLHAIYFFGNTHEGAVGCVVPSQGIFIYDERALKNKAQFPNYLECQISQTLKEYLPPNVQDVQVWLTAPDPSFSAFYYFHALKNHAGNCQRFHGHSSQICLQLPSQHENTKNSEEYKIHEAVIKVHRETSLQNEQEKLSQTICGKIFIDTNDQKDFYSLATWQKEFLDKHQELKNENCVLTAYQGTQGEYFLALPVQKVYTIPYPTTIENIARHFAHLYPNYKIKVFEGLSKGAIARFANVQEI